METGGKEILNFPVIPAEAGIQTTAKQWIPTYVGMTGKKPCSRLQEISKLRKGSWQIRLN
jgi:hypothetical protein